MSEKIETDCYCYAAKRQVIIKGVVVGKRQADLLRIKDCVEDKCLHRNEPDCLIGKIREGKWPMGLFVEKEAGE